MKNFMPLNETESHLKGAFLGNRVTSLHFALYGGEYGALQDEIIQLEVEEVTARRYTVR